MHLVPKPDRLDRAIANTPGLHVFLTCVAFMYCLDRGAWLIGGIYLVVVAISLLNEYLPHLPAKKRDETTE